MCLGSVGAWAQTKTITLADIDFSNSIVTSSSSPKYTIEGTVGKMTWDEQWTVAPYISDGILRFGNFTGTVDLADGIEQSNGVVTVSFDLAFGKLSNKQIGFSFLDSEGNYIIEQLFDAYNADFNDKNPLGLDWNNMYRGQNTPLQDRCVYFTIIFDYNTSKITTRTKCYKSGTGKSVTNAEYVVDMTNTSYISSFRLYGNINNADRYSTFDNLKITTESKYEIKDVFIGSLTSEGNDVIAEDFESMESLSSSWEVNEVNSIGFSTVENVESPEVASAPIGIPTYVSGKTFRGYIRQGSNAGERFSSFNFGAPLDKGKIMFSADFFSSGNVNTPIKLRFTDKNGNSLFSIGYKNGSSFQYLYYTIDGSAVQTSARSDYRNYAGFGIKDMVIDIETGDVSFTFDCINRYGVREHVSIKFNIGTGKNIAKMQIGKAAISSTDLYYHLDNVKLYTVGLVTGELNYTVAAKCGDDIVKTIKTGTSHGGKVVPVTGLPLVVENNGNFYTLDDAQVEKFSSAFQMNYADYEHTYNYVASPDVVFFREGESSQGTDARYSSGGSGTVAAQNKRDRGISVGTLPVGEYEFIVNIPTEETNKRSLVIRQSQNDPLASVGLSNADMTTGIKTAIFKLTEETSSLFINGANSGTEKTNLSVLFDYVMVKIKSVPLTLTSAGVSTLCSPYNLDFTDAQNVAAYKAEIDEENGKIRLEKVTTVAAREGVLIRSLSGEAVAEDVPASASAFEVNEGNDFIGTLVNINNQASEDEEYRYYILGGKKNAEGNMVYGFYLAGGKNIGAGKAYLKVPKSAAAKFSFFALEDETTGIEDIHAVQHDDTKVYDLSGRRVVKPSKGLYIKNGKKFIVK